MTDAHVVMVTRIAHRLVPALPPWVDPKDLIQEGAMAVLRAEWKQAAGLFEERGIPLDHYASSCARFAMLEWVRGARRDQPMSIYNDEGELIEQAGPPVDVARVDDVLARRPLQRALGRLSPKERALLVRFYTGARLADLATEERASVQAIHQRIRYALSRLRRYMGVTDEPKHHRLTRGSVHARRYRARILERARANADAAAQQPDRVLRSAEPDRARLVGTGV